MRYLFPLCIFSVFLLAASSAFAATVTVGPSGCDYTNIIEAQASFADKDLVSQQINVIFELYGEWKESAYITGWTCDADYKLRITAGSGRPLIYDDSPVLAGGYTLGIDSNYVEISGIHLLANTSDTAFDGDYALYISYVNYITITDCILDSTTSGAAYNIAGNLRGSYLTIDNCTITGTRGISDMSSGTSDIMVSNCVFRDGANWYAFYKRYGNNLTLRNCVFRNWLYSYAVYVDQCDNYKLYNNMINASTIGFTSMFVGVTNPSHSQGYVVNNTIYGVKSLDSGIYLADVTDGNTQVRNNIIYLVQDGYGLYFVNSNSANVTCDNNCVYDSGGTGYFGRYESTNYNTRDDWYAVSGMDCCSIEDNPDFLSADPSSPDWLHLTSFSPCIGMGANLTGVFSTDIDGDTRPSSGAWCIGADKVIISLDTPTNFRCTGCSSNTLTFAWDDVTSEEGYQIFDNVSDALVIDDVAADSVTTIESGLSENQQYLRHCLAYTTGKTVFSNKSNSISVYTLVADPLDSEFSVAATSPTSVSMSVTQPPNPTAGLTGSEFATAGTVFGTGSNTKGQVGDGIPVLRYSPVRVFGITTAQKVSNGTSHGIALLSNGYVMAWGSNSYGQLGDGTSTMHEAPAPVNGITNAIDVAAGVSYSLALLSDGSVRSWGYNSNGQLGDGTKFNRNLPVSVTGISNAISVSGGLAHSLAVLSDGSVMAWGRNDKGQIGDGTIEERLTPVPVTGISDALTVSAGYYHSLALLSNGTIAAWGENDYGKLGDNTTTQRETPILVHGITNAISVSAGADHSTAVLDNGWVVGWGINGGRLGDGTSSQRLTPVPAVGITNAVAVSAGNYHTHVAVDNGSAYGYGSGINGVLGHGSDASSLFPVKVIGISSAVAVSARYHFAFALLSNGRILGWGSNTNGQLGDGTQHNRFSTVPLSGMSNVTGVSAGKMLSLAVFSDGSVFSWGYNNYGQLGDGTNQTNMTPSPVSGLSTVVEVSAGGFFSLARHSDGTMSAWGYNNDGALGDGSMTDRWTPVTVSGITDAISIAAGGSHSIALRSNNTIYTWGRNDNGQLGDGSEMQSSTPIPLGGAVSNVIGIAAGTMHSLAVLSNGSVLAWGDNSKNQLGDGTINDSNVPKIVPGITNAVGVAAGMYHSLAVLEDGSVRGWGWNYYGEVGDGTSTQRSTPVPVNVLTDAVSVTAGDSHSFAICSDGSLYGWGSSSLGQLGIGVWANKSSPFLISGFTDLVSVSGGFDHSLILGKKSSGWLAGTYSSNFNDITPNGEYAFLVRLRNGDGVETAWSGSKTVNMPSNKPHGLWIGDISNESMTLFWALSNNPEWTTYQIEMSTDDVVYNPVAEVTGLEYSNTSLVPGRRNYYRIRAINMDGVPTAWAYASEITIGPPGAPTTLLTNGKANPESLGCDSITLSAIYPECNPPSSANAAWVVVDNDPSFLSPEWNSTWMTLDPPVGNL
ncbi:MAG: RCC1 domain-containing protein, partial [Planctomycetota bacterium]